jgi:hypothetical protein
MEWRFSNRNAAAGRAHVTNMEVFMAHKGIGFFDSRGHMFKTPEEATLSDLALMLGRIGEGDSLAPGIATMLLERRADLERIFAEHDELKLEQAAAKADRPASNLRVLSLPELSQRRSSQSAPPP